MSVRAQAAVVDLAVSVALTAIGTVASQAMPEAPRPSLLGSAVAAILGLFAYHVLFAGLVGPSLGRSWARLTLSRRGATGRIPVWLAVARSFVAIGSAVPFGAGYLAGLGTHQRTWPDEVSGVAVVLAPRPEPPGWMAATAAVVAASSVTLAIGAVYLLGIA